jgi:aminotransferase
MGLSVSNRQEQVLQSDIRTMTIACERVGGINLSQGVCDTPVPELVLQGAQKAIADGFNIYTHYAGLKELRAAIAQKQRLFTGLNMDPESEIIVSAGATGAMYCAFLALLNPGDEVIVFEPYYGYHINTLRAVQAVPVFVRMSSPDWSFTENDLESRTNARTRGIILNTPANPSGKVFSRTEIELIADYAVRHDLFVFTDEIYEHFLYDDRPHIAPATLPGMRERTITISGASKTFSVTGWRIGYCLCAKPWAEPIGYFNDLVYVCAPSPLQIGVARGLMSLERSYYESLSREYQAKREMICTALKQSGLEPYVPQGAYYVLADIRGIPGTDSRARAMHILDRTGVACVPGRAFYHDDSGEGLARFCFAKEDHILEDACRRLAQL